MRTRLPHDWRAAANHEPRKGGKLPDMLLLHYTGMKTAEAAINWLASAESQVSCHYVIDEQGRITQMVSEVERAWHAGVSQFCGREKCNDFSIGIELEGDGDTPFTNEQYASLAEVTGVLLKKYPDLQFAGHSDIAPERKTDPGPSFDWVRLTKIAKLSEEKLPFGSASR